MKRNHFTWLIYNCPMIYRIIFYSSICISHYVTCCCNSINTQFINSPFAICKLFCQHHLLLIKSVFLGFFHRLEPLCSPYGPSILFSLSGYSQSATLLAHNLTVPFLMRLKFQMPPAITTPLFTKNQTNIDNLLYYLLITIFPLYSIFL